MNIWFGLLSGGGPDTPKTVEMLATVRLACEHGLQLLNFITLFLSLQQYTVPTITNTIKMLPKEDDILNFNIPI